MYLLKMYKFFHIKNLKLHELVRIQNYIPYKKNYILFNHVRQLFLVLLQGFKQSFV